MSIIQNKNYRTIWKKSVFSKFIFDDFFSLIGSDVNRNKHEYIIHRRFVRFFIEYTDMMNAAVFVVALILFSSSLVSLAADNVVLPSMCYFLLTVGWRSFSFFVYYVRRPWPVAAKREREKWAMSLFFLLHSQWTDDDERNEWMVNEHHSLFFSCSIWRSVQTHCRFIKQQKRRLTTSLWLHPSSPMIKDKQ
jgi:hypothetical protein